MGQVIDTCVWIDSLRQGTPEANRQIANAALLQSGSLLCEPVRFELLHGALPRERPALLRRLETMPKLSTPQVLWQDAAELGTIAIDAGLRLRSLDLLIAALCIHHGAGLTTFDDQFSLLAKHCKLQVELLVRPQ